MKGEESYELEQSVNLVHDQSESRIIYNTISLDNTSLTGNSITLGGTTTSAILGGTTTSTIWSNGYTGYTSKEDSDDMLIRLLKDIMEKKIDLNTATIIYNFIKNVHE